MIIMPKQTKTLTR